MSYIDAPKVAKEWKPMLIYFADLVALVVQSWNSKDKTVFPFWLAIGSDDKITSLVKTLEACNTISRNFWNVIVNVFRKITFMKLISTSLPSTMKSA